MSRPSWYLPVMWLAYFGILLGLIQSAVACALAIGAVITFDQWVTMAGGGQVNVLLGAGIWKTVGGELDDA